MPCGATQDGQVMVERSNRMWSTGEGNGKPLQYSCLENPMNSMKRQNDRILKEELPRSVGAQYATRDQWRNNSRKNEGMEPKQTQYPVLDVTGDRSKVRCCKEQYCIGTWNVRSIPFLSFIEPTFAWNIPLISLIFLKRSLVFPVCSFPLFLCIDCWRRLSYLFFLFFGTLHSNGYIFSHLPFTCLLFPAICKPYQTTILPFCISSPWGWSWSLSPVQCHKPPSIVHQALHLSDLVPESISHFGCLIIRDLI